MTSLSSLGHDERSARTVLSLVAAPNDPSTGRLVGRVGAVELLRLADADGAVPGLDQIAAAVWRERLHTVSSADTLATQMATFERQGLRVLIPGGKDWPVALSDLGELTPYALWTRGETALLAKPLADRDLPNLLRHTGATWLADAGVPLHVLQEILGHASIETTRGYLHPDDRHLASAAEQANAFLSRDARPNASGRPRQGTGRGL